MGNATQFPIDRTKHIACDMLAPPVRRLRHISSAQACASLAERFLYHRKCNAIFYDIKKTEL
mgnify:CR=1 FL=1